MAPRPVSLLAFLLTALLVASTAHAQASSGAQSTYIDPSTRASGMGHAGAAVFWGPEVDDWSNPALLGSYRGVQYLHRRWQLVPDLADDIYFTSKRIVLGGGGIGLSLAGKPFDGLGETRLDYGESEATDPDGNAIGTFESYERIRQLGVGVNVLEAAESLLRLMGKEPRSLGRRVDLSVGHAWKSVLVDLAPAWATLDGRAGRGEATERDMGALLRVTPLDQMGDPDFDRPGARWRLDAVVGFTRRNYTDHRISYIDEDQADPMTEERIVGLAVRATADFGGERRGWIDDFVSSTLTAGATVEEVRYYDGGRTVGGETVRRSGEEFVLADLIAIRHGYVDDPTGTIQNHTWGVGLQVCYRKAVGVRYDFASVPQSRYLDRVDRDGLTFFVDPYAVWKELR